MDKNEISPQNPTPREHAKYLSLIMQELWIAVGQIRGCITTLLEDSKHTDAETAREFLKDIGRNVDLMDRLLAYGKQLTAFETEKSSELLWTEVGPLIERALSDLNSEVKLDVFIADGLPEVKIDPAHFNLVFQYLVNAAIEHASQADGIEIQARLDEGRVVVEIISLGADKVSSLFDQVDVQTLRSDVAALQSALDRYLAHALIGYAGAK